MAMNGDDRRDRRWVLSTWASLLLLLMPGLGAWVQASDLRAESTHSRSLEQPLRITVHQGRLSVDLQDAEVGEVLERIGQQAGIAVTFGAGIGNRVSTQFAGVEFEQGLRRVLQLASLNHTIFYAQGRAGAVVIKEVHVLGPQEALVPPSGEAEREATARGAEGHQPLAGPPAPAPAPPPPAVGPEASELAHHFQNALAWGHQRSAASPLAAHPSQTAGPQGEAPAGGGMSHNGGALRLTDRPVAEDQADSRGGGLPLSGAGGGILNHGGQPMPLNGTVTDKAGTAARTDRTGGNAGRGASTDSGPPDHSPSLPPSLPGSPAIDAGDDTACPPTDQLGESRDGRCDGGAGESPSVNVSVRVDRTTLRPGETVRMTVGLRNPGPTVRADLFIGVWLPDGAVRFVPDTVTRIDADPRTFTPVLAAVEVPSGVELPPVEVLAYTVSEADAPGTSLFFVLLTPPGAVRGERPQPGDLEGLVWHAQPVVVEPGEGPPQVSRR